MERPDLSIIAAFDLDRGIGREGRLPWRNATDLKRFQRLTDGSIVIMGRKTWDSLPMQSRPLPNRINVVISRKARKREGALVFKSLTEALKVLSGVAPMWVIGGQDMYEQAIPLARQMYLTKITGRFGCDRFFPEYDESEWEILSTNHPPRATGDVHEARFVNLCRKEEIVDMDQVRANADVWDSHFKPILEQAGA